MDHEPEPMQVLTVQPTVAKIPTDDQQARNIIPVRAPLQEKSANSPEIAVHQEVSVMPVVQPRVQPMYCLYTEAQLKATLECFKVGGDEKVIAKLSF